jgi:starch phosphorylase
MTYRKLPARIIRLGELAYNLWWSWHPLGRDLFRALDYQLWRNSGHNPVLQLDRLSDERLFQAAQDPEFTTLYDTVMAAFDADNVTGDGTWFAHRYPGLHQSKIAYFSMEFAIHDSLPIYAGGLGVLAGDLCKESSDLGLPLVGVGFMYPQGYFHQEISPDGWQEEIYQQLDFDEAPIERVISPAGKSLLASVQLGDISLALGAWRVQTGRNSLYLLDTDLPENPFQYRQLLSRLYTADPEQRIQQEIILGIGGVRLLRALGIQPAVWHANEGHTAFMTLERAREAIAGGDSFAEAARKVRASTIFTTHTPVLAGHDRFSLALMDKYFAPYWGALQLSRDAFLELGRENSIPDEPFNMTALALKMADFRNGVSQLHGQVSRRMWHGLWPDLPEEKVPISSVTNGVHVPSWISEDLGRLYNQYLGPDWREKQDDVSAWERAAAIPDGELWATRQLMKRKLVGAVLRRARLRWAEADALPQQVLAMGSLLDPEVLTLGFVRRFVEYKRPTLIFRDLERLRQIIHNDWRPVQIIFAGKSHPADVASKQLLHQVCSFASSREFRGRIAFIEDYDLYIARYLVSGVDVWLNNPRRLQEACGTSGMKAALNGVLQLSVRDGWWNESYNGLNGWAVGGGPYEVSPGEEDSQDVRSLYDLLEKEIVPLYYNRDRNGVPHGWLKMVKESLRSITPLFSAQRMVKEYTEKMYLPAARI